ncbi:DNA phosphorothioation system sulfurtransferase DndC, partial [bacterium]|nr:DNA phosphorothioation system sulfurtransferase DndC [bacterium]
NTGVENPLIERRVAATINAINSAAKAADLPLHAVIVGPERADSFWVNLIGRGYPAPTKRFRWCTSRLKIDPVSAFVRSQVASFGEVIMVLGVRSQESVTRANAMRSHSLGGTELRRHAELTGAYVYAPIEDWSTDDVWTFLLQVPSPWGENNRDLAALYRSASGDECPLVIDASSPSCGKSRFGCWVCTVAAKDSSMAALIDDGHEWLLPLLEYRDFLFETTDPEKKRQYRDSRGRDGRVQVKRDGKLAARSYTLDASRKMLESLLSIENEMKSEDPGIELVSREELECIRRIWVYERQDWADSLPGIVATFSAPRGKWPPFDDLGFDAGYLELLDDCAVHREVPAALLKRLLEVERHSRVTSRRGVHQAVRRTLEL